MPLNEEDRFVILERLDSLIQDVRDIKSSNGLMEANYTLIAGEIARIAKCFSDHETRISLLEDAARNHVPNAPRIASFTSEAIADSIGESIRTAAMAHTEPLKKSIEKSENRSLLVEIVKAVVLTLIIVMSIFAGRH